MNDDQEHSRVRVWLLAARPKTLPAGIVPVIIGGALAWDTGVFHVPSFVLALAGSVMIQIGANFANDLFDCLKGTDDSERVGPLRVTQAGLVTPRQMKLATFAVFALAFLIGCYLVYRGGWPIVAIGLTSILFGVLYTGGPRPLGYIGLGDILVLIFYGPIAVGGTYYVCTLSFDSIVVLAGIPPGMLSTAILTVNNLRDVDNDRRTGKRTLAVRFGRSFALFEYGFMLICAALFPVLIFLTSGAHPWSMAAGLMLLPGFFVIRKVATTTSGTVLNSALADTGQLLMFYGLLFSMGWLL